MEVNLVVEATKFMILGMGTVYLFLYLMIIVMNIQGAILQRYFPDKKSSTTHTATQSTSSSKNRVAAIMAAILHHNQHKA
ncbi:MAG: hypothetical protein KU37_11040 [Sulfuricurvum sp. PC08-66]|nr:MAG: hypothetical protein KU37_11040 [Sulfuricurvum sp. PC08-66]